MESKLEAEAAKQQSKISRMFRLDTFLLLIFVVFAWIVLSLVLPSVLSLIANHVLRAFIIVLFFVILGVYTSSIVAVYFHLRKNKTEIYMDEIHAKAAMKKAA